MAKVLTQPALSPLTSFERLQLFSELTLLGSYYGLDSYIHEYKLAEELEPFRDEWKPYNPNKKGYGRYGLSITSLDGSLSGLPDLTSLFEHNRIHGTEYTESSFRRLTPVYSACESLHEFVNPFLPYLCRSHFLKFDRGGFFPYHRDFNRPPEAFRIFVPLYNHSARDFVFLLGPDKINLERGRPYFINTIMEHALFCFESPSLHMVLNIHLCRESVDLVRRQLAAY